MAEAKKSGSVLKILLGIFLIGILACTGAAAYGWHYLQTTINAPGPFAEDQVLTVTEGSGSIRIAQQLEREGLITDARFFRIATRLAEADTDLKAGEFAIPANASMNEIIEVLREGKSILYPITLVEGATTAMALRVIEAADMLTGDLPETLPEEGTLLPDTYLVARGMRRADLIKKMQQSQTDLIDDLWEKRDADIPVSTKEEAVILASIVEKETGVAEERPMVASVFTNRLRRGIRLQSDPTIIYPITKGEPLGRRIRQSEIDAVNGYNTYQIDGLPVGPICNPGRESIAAVLNPPESDYLFFVADGTGGHAFATSLNEHNRNVREWYKIRDNRP